MTGDGKVVRKRKAIMEGDLRNVSMSEAQAKSAIAEDKRKADNRSMPWLAGTHDHTHLGSARNITRRVCNKVRKNWADRNGRDLDWVLRDSGPDDVVSRHRGLEFLKKDLMRLQGDWLNDKIIDSYLELLQLRNNRQRGTNPLSAQCFFSCAFAEKLSISGTGYAYQDVSRWTNSIDFFNMNNFFFPINRHNMHWTFVHIDMIGRTISYYDSMNSQHDAVQYCLLFRKWLCDETEKRMAPLNLVALGWRDICAVCPQQTPMTVECM